MEDTLHKVELASPIRQRVAVITGGNGGIGLESVRGLAAQGWMVIFGSRDQAKNLEVVKQLKDKSVKSFKLDLSQSASVQFFAGKVRKQVGHIDVLLNNAGIMFLPQRRMSKDMREMQFAVNHLGHFQLTFLLFDLLKKAECARVINLSSSAHFQCSELVIQDLPSADDYSPWGRYCATKLCNVLFTCRFNSLCEEAGLKIRSYSLHPGVVATNLADQNCWSKCIWTLCGCCMKSPMEGARCSLFLATADNSKIRPGEFYDSDTAWKEMNPLGRSKRLQEELWILSEQLLGFKFKPA